MLGPVESIVLLVVVVGALALLVAALRFLLGLLRGRA